MVFKTKNKHLTFWLLSSSRSYGNTVENFSIYTIIHDLRLRFTIYDYDIRLLYGYIRFLFITLYLFIQLFYDTIEE